MFSIRSDFTTVSHTFKLKKKKNASLDFGSETCASSRVEADAEQKV